ncbi:hypothetical protein GIB67_042852, partial [Kingdonia uniflora]
MLIDKISVKRLRGITDGVAAEPIGPSVAAESLKMICLKEIYNGQCFGPLIVESKKLKTLKLFRCSGDWDKLSLGLLGANCWNLQRLALCASETIGDAEICCIASKCMALKKFCIKGCPISDHGMEALAIGCPNLVKLKVKKYRGVTCEDRYPSNVSVVENEGLISHSAAEADIASSSNDRSSLSKA